MGEFVYIYIYIALIQLFCLLCHKFIHELEIQSIISLSLAFFDYLLQRLNLLP